MLLHGAQGQEIGRMLVVGDLRVAKGIAETWAQAQGIAGQLTAPWSGICR